MCKGKLPVFFAVSGSSTAGVYIGVEGGEVCEDVVVGG